MPPLDEIFSWLFKIIFTAAMSFLWWGKKEDKKELKSNSKSIIELQSKAMTEDKTRQIIKDEFILHMKPVQEDITEIKGMISGIQRATSEITIKIAKREGYEEALKELKHVINSHKKLVEALKKYGDHEPGCVKGDACNCGFEQVLEGEK